MILVVYVLIILAANNGIYKVCADMICSRDGCCTDRTLNLASPYAPVLQLAKGHTPPTPSPTLVFQLPKCCWIVGGLKSSNLGSSPHLRVFWRKQALCSHIKLVVSQEGGKHPLKLNRDMGITLSVSWDLLKHCSTEIYWKQHKEFESF